MEHQSVLLLELSMEEVNQIKIIIIATLTTVTVIIENNISIETCYFMLF